MKVPSSRYRGVVAQQSGKWGAQIYKNDNHIWLGTFFTEVEAAQTYDLAARCLHGTNAVTNFNSFTESDIDADDEGQFLKLHTTTEILSMLRRQTYHDKLKRRRYLKCSNSTNDTLNVKEARQLLFIKVISPGDVGPQNRLLIPRQHAKKYFPCFDSGNGANRRGMMVKFEDENGKIWRFRYAFWSSSGIRVFNGGWAEFAREKGLRAGDKIKFWRVTNELGRVHFFIECHTKRTTIQPSPVLDLPVDQPPADKIIRLFGFNVSASVKSN